MAQGNSKQPSPEAENRIVFRGANLIDGREAARPETTLVVQGDRIEAICPDAAFEPKPGDTVHDLDGKSIMPGMVQCHFHSHFGAFGSGVTAPALGLERAPAYLALLAGQNAGIALDAGFTGAIGSSNAHTIDVSLKEAIQAGIIRGPRYLAGSREVVTTGESSDYPNNRNFFMQLGDTGLTYAVNGAEAWALAARVEGGRGCDVIKISASPGHGSVPSQDILYPTREELHALVEAAHKLGKKVRAHAASRTAILECARAGVDIIDHADRIDAECIEAILDSDCTVVPSMLWSARFLEIAESWDHDASPLPISEGFPETPDEVRAKIARVRDEFEYTCQAIPEAARAGVRMVVGDDFGTPIMPHGDYIAEFELYVKTLGMAPLDVIRWATQNGAEAMGLGDRTGTLEVGKWSDLLIVDGDPLVDIGILADRANLLAIRLGDSWVKNTLGSGDAGAA